jgi:hypothetical protein
MIRHIVLWKLDDSYSEKEKKKILDDFRSRLLALDQKITVLLHIEVYLKDKSAQATNYDIMLDTVLNSMADLETYQAHPDHQKVGAYVRTLKAQRAAIDFTF